MRTFRVDKPVEFDSTRKIVETDTEIIVPTIFTRESILPFEDGKGYRSADQLRKYGWTLEDAWLVSYDHIKTVFPTSPHQVRGKARNITFSDKISALVGESHFFKGLCPEAFQKGVKKGDLKDVSVGYFSEDVMGPGKWADEPFDFEQTEFFFGHVAAGVPEGRCPSPFCGMSVDALFAHGDPEETEGFVHLRVRDPDLFVEGGFRTIDIDAKKGIKAVIGKLKSDPKGSTVIQKYIFDKEKDWTMEKAKAWVSEHKDAATNLSLEEIKAKIRELEAQRRSIMDKLYPKSQLTEEEQRALGEDLTVLDAEMKAFTEFLAEKLGEASEAAEPEADSLDPEKVLARSRELLKSR